jgi:hypothetical protein
LIIASAATLSVAQIVAENMSYALIGSLYEFPPLPE